ncbi:RNA polymerase sigma factor [Peribacillus sp. NPDC096447]|uniref:RNA polymerase sigma factor n=1 Tax=Peribacillus sp. NPDC096447 TaxID=3364394 RepID=UPI00382F0100
MKYELEDFLKEKMKMLFRYLLKMGVNEMDAQDIIQDTMIKAWSYLGEIDPAKLNSWLFRVAVNQFYDLCRKQKRAVYIPIHPAHIIEEEGPESLVLTEEQKHEFQGLLDQVKPDYKHILLMKYEFNMSYKEIAQTLDIKEETVKTWLYRARKQFEKVYGRSEHGKK